jgi:hypothetical protein
MPNISSYDAGLFTGLSADSVFSGKLTVPQPDKKFFSFMELYVEIRVYKSRTLNTIPNMSN